MLFSEGEGRSLINKNLFSGSAERNLKNQTTGLQDENTLISAGAGEV
jgi:hypothetical protein